MPPENNNIDTHFSRIFKSHTFIFWFDRGFTGLQPYSAKEGGKRETSKCKNNIVAYRPVDIQRQQNK
jgi:hypothetical protein